MKFATVAAVKAFVNQVKENALEVAKKSLTNAGYTVTKTVKKEKEPNK